MTDVEQLDLGKMAAIFLLLLDDSLKLIEEMTNFVEVFSSMTNLKLFHAALNNTVAIFMHRTLRPGVTTSPCV